MIPEVANSVLGDKDEEKAPPLAWINLACIAAVANLGSLLFGFDFGATGCLLSRIAEFKDGTINPRYTYFVIVAQSSALTGLIAAGSSIGATLAFIFLLFLGNDIPKNDEIVLSALFYFIGALLESTSGNISWRNSAGLVILIIGRFVFGAGIALSFHSVPQYISEISPKIGRGSIGSLVEAMTVIGVCLGFIVGYLNGSENGFIVTFRVGYLIAVLMGILAMFIPRSPQWLYKNGADDTEILNSLQYIRPTATLSLVLDLKESEEEGIIERNRWENKMRIQIENLKVFLSEIFPQFVRSAAISIAVATLFAWSSIVILILPSMNTKFGLLPVFILYTVTGALSVLLLYFLVPETRGIDLEIAYKLVNGRMEKTLQICFSEISGKEEECGLISVTDMDDIASYEVLE